MSIPKKQHESGSGQNFRRDAMIAILTIADCCKRLTGAVQHFQRANDLILDGEWSRARVQVARAFRTVKRIAESGDADLDILAKSEAADRSSSPGTATKQATR